MNTREYVCNYINEWMKENHVTNQQFGDSIGVSNVSINRWRNGICAPDINLLPKVCEFMGITVNELLDMNSGSLTPEQISFINKYNDDESFRNLVNSYRDDDELRLTLDYIVKLHSK